MVGAADSVSLLFELWFWQQQSSSSEREGVFLLSVIPRFWGLGVVLCSFTISYLLSAFFVSLPIFSRYAGPFDHAGAGVGSTKKYKLFYFYS